MEKKLNQRQSEIPKYRNKWGSIKDLPVRELLNRAMRSVEEKGLLPCPGPAWVLSSLLGYGCSQTAHAH